MQVKRYPQKLRFEAKLKKSGFFNFCFYLIKAKKKRSRRK